MINFLSNKTYTNRYRDEYSFVSVTDNTYKFVMENLQYFRCGGKEGEAEPNINDLGMIDPSGGPFMEPNTMSIDGREVIRIFSTEEFFCFEVK